MICGDHADCYAVQWFLAVHVLMCSNAFSYVPALRLCDYRYSVAVAVASVIVVLWAGIQVGKARKRFNIPYPQVY
jgi:uncharacterized membrane protein YoaK (UPF0700 family)